MKIACVSSSEVPSSRANSLQVMKVCQALAQLGEEVALYLPTGPSTNWDDLMDIYGLTERFPIIRFASRPLLKRIDFAIAAVNYARKAHVDLIYTRMVWVAWLARFTGLKSVLEMHDLPRGRLGPLIYRWYIRSRAPGLTVYITKALKELTDQAISVKARPDEFMIAPDGVDLERYESLPDATQARANLGLPENFTAAYTGGFYAGRGLDILEQLAQAFPQVKFLWIGGTVEQVDTWRERLDSKGLRNVTLTGHLPNSQLPLYQAAADILLMPYNRAFGGSSGGDISRVSSPLKLFEYLASGRAILASDLPVLREVLSEQTTCFFEPEDINDLCEKFSQLLSNSAQRKRLGDAARICAKDYDWKARMSRILKTAGLLRDHK